MIWPPVDVEFFKGRGCEFFLEEILTIMDLHKIWWKSKILYYVFMQYRNQQICVS